MLLPKDLEYFSKRITPNNHLFQCTHCENIFSAKDIANHLETVHNQDISTKSFFASLFRCTKRAAIFHLNFKSDKNQKIDIFQAVENYLHLKREKFITLEKNQLLLEEKQRKRKKERLHYQNKMQILKEQSGV